MKTGCSICDWIRVLKSGKDQFLIKELETGYAVLSKYQYYKGYTLFISKLHKTELHMLKPKVRDKFLHEMAFVAESVYKTVKPHKLNYELLGNREAHLHWHLIPRFSTEATLDRPVWILDESIRQSRDTYPNAKQREVLKLKIRAYLS